MPINGLSISDGATSLSVTGGTALAFTDVGQVVANGINVAATSIADFRVRPHITFKNKNPQRKSNGTFTQGTRTIVFTVPYLDSVTGVVHYDTYTIERRYSSVIPATNLANNRKNAAQLLFDTDTENFNSVGSLA